MRKKFFLSLKKLFLKELLCYDIDNLLVFNWLLDDPFKCEPLAVRTPRDRYLLDVNGPCFKLAVTIFIFVYEKQSPHPPKKTKPKNKTK